MARSFIQLLNGLGLQLTPEAANPGDALTFWVDSGDSNKLKFGAVEVQLGSGVAYPLLAPDGTVGAPSYAFTNSTSSGLTSLATDEVSLVANGVAALTVTDSVVRVPLGSPTTDVPGLEFGTTGDGLGYDATIPGLETVGVIVGGTAKYLFNAAFGFALSTDLPVSFQAPATRGNLQLPTSNVEPSTPQTDDTYMDDGTNTASGNPGWRRFNGAIWQDVGAVTGSGAASNIEYASSTPTFSNTGTPITSGTYATVATATITKAAAGTTVRAFGSIALAVTPGDSIDVRILRGAVEVFALTGIEVSASIPMEVEDTGAPAGSVQYDMQVRVTAGGITSAYYFTNVSAQEQRGGGSTTAAPAGANTQVQYNNAGVLAGATGLAYNNGTNSLAVTGAVTGASFSTIGNISGALTRVGFGAAAAPTYSFTGDTDVGMFRRNANELGFSAAGVDHTYLRGNSGVSTAQVIVAGSNSQLSNPQFSFGGASTTGVTLGTTNVGVALVVGGTRILEVQARGANFATTANGSPSDGDIWYDSTDDRFKVRENGVTSNITGVAGPTGELLLSAAGTDNLGTENLGSFAALTTGGDNIGIGRDTLALETVGNGNIGIGDEALSKIVSGQGNTAIGDNVAPNLGDSGSLFTVNTFLGREAGKDFEQGTANTFIGWLTGTNGTGTSISNSTAVGNQSTVAASRALAIGNQARVSHTDSIAIGQNIDTTASGQVVISPSTFGGQMYLGNGVVSGTPAYIALNSTSASGTDITGARFEINAGRSTGTGNGGWIYLATSLPGSTGSTLNPLTDIMWVRGDNGLVELDTSLSFIERADHAGSPTAGAGQVWVRSSDNNLIYTNDSGVDFVLNAAAAGGLLVVATGTQNIGTTVLGVTMGAITTGQQNVGIGDDVLTALEDGFSNIAIGNGNLNAVVGGSYNIALGTYVAQTLTSGSCTVIVGDASDGAASDTSFAVLVGANGVVGTDSVGMGENSATGLRATALGRSAQTGDDGIAIGYLSSTTTTTESIAIGGVSNLSNELIIGGDGSVGFPINTAVIGRGTSDGAAAAHTTVLRTTDGLGTDITGAALTIGSGRGTGTGVGGDLVLATSSPGATGSSLNTYVARLTINGATGDILVSGSLTATGGLIGAGLLVDAGVGTDNYGTTSLGALAVVAAGASDNYAIGTGALAALTTGDDNVAIGRSAGAGVTTADWSVSVGGTANASGIGAVAYGYGTVASGTGSVALGLSANVSHAHSIALGRTATTTASFQCVIGGVGGGTQITNVYFGSGVTNSSPTASVALNATGGSGTDVAGASLILAGGLSTGNATPGNIAFQIGDPGASGTTSQTLATIATISNLGLEVGRGVVLSGFQSVVGAGGAPDFTATGAQRVFRLSGNANTCTLNLEATPVTGQVYTIKCVDDTNTVTVAGNGNNLIDGGGSSVASVTLAAGESETAYFDGSNWLLV